MNKVTVKIQGSEYQMTGDKPVEKMKQIADYVDSEMSTIAEANSRLSISAVSILTALNIADLLFECSEENQEIAKELEELQANAETGINSEAAKELEEKIALKDQEIEELKNGVESKNSELEELQKRMAELMEIVEEKKKEILELQNPEVCQEMNVDERIKELEEKLAEANKKVETAEQIASEFQNNAYELQLENTELKNKLDK